MGKAMQYVDEKPLAGINTYYVVPSRVEGEIGVPDSIRCYMGVDVPGAVPYAYIEKKGEGIHHIAFAVPDVQAALDDAEAKGVRLIDKAPRGGAEGLSIAFLHPKSTCSVLTELCMPGKK